MAKEARLIVETDSPINFTVAEATGIEQGSLLKLSDLMTAAAHAEGNTGLAFAGIAAKEKIASDGRTTLAVFRRGIFKVYLSGAATAGAPLVLDKTPNHLKADTAALKLSGGHIVGTALETGATGEQILVEIGGTCGSA